MILVVQVVRRKAIGSQALLSYHHEALWVTYKPLTKPDKDLLERCTPLSINPKLPEWGTLHAVISLSQEGCQAQFACELLPFIQK